MISIELRNGINLKSAFSLLKNVRVYRRRHFPFLRDSIDYGLVLHIGHEQINGKPMNLTYILTASLVPPTSVIRRLNKLVKLGIICKAQLITDRRVSLYYLAETHVRVFAAYSKYLKNIARELG